MKVIIEIPEKTIAHIRSDYGHGYKIIHEEDRDKIVDAIYHCTPLADVRTEIVKAYEDATMYSCDGELPRFASRVCGILNCMGKESEVSDAGSD